MITTKKKVSFHDISRNFWFEKKIYYLEQHDRKMRLEQYLFRQGYTNEYRYRVEFQIPLTTTTELGHFYSSFFSLLESFPCKASLSQTAVEFLTLDKAMEFIDTYLEQIKRNAWFYCSPSFR